MKEIYAKLIIAITIGEGYGESKRLLDEYAFRVLSFK